MKISEHVLSKKELNTIQKHTEEKDHELPVVITRSESSYQSVKSRDNLYGNMLYMMYYISFTITYVYMCRL